MTIEKQGNSNSVSEVYPRRDSRIIGLSSFTHHQLPAPQSCQTIVQLICLSCSHCSLQALWHMAGRLTSTWNSRNSYHQTWLYPSHAVSQQDCGARHPKGSSDNKNLALPAGAGKPAKSPGLGTMTWVKEAEEVRKLQTKGNRKGGLERAVCKTLFPSQSSHPAAMA